MNSFSIGGWLFALGVALILKLIFHIGANRVRMKNPYTGQRKSGYFGFSWTYLFFGWLVPLLRGELSIAALHLLFTIVTLGLWQPIVCFVYNSQYTNRKILEGYRFADVPEGNAAAAKKLGIDLAMHNAVPAV